MKEVVDFYKLFAYFFLFSSKSQIVTLQITLVRDQFQLKSNFVLLKPHHTDMALY